MPSKPDAVGFFILLRVRGNEELHVKNLFLRRNRKALHATSKIFFSCSSFRVSACTLFTAVLLFRVNFHVKLRRKQKAACCSRLSFYFIRSLFHQYVLHFSQQKRCVRLASLGRHFPHISHFLRSPSRFRLDMNICLNCNRTTGRPL